MTAQRAIGVIIFRICLGEICDVLAGVELMSEGTEEISAVCSGVVESDAVKDAFRGVG